MSEFSSWSDKETQEMQRIAREAGACVMSCRNTGGSIERKPDGTPVTGADRKAQEIIIRMLEAFTPGVPIIAEEQENPQHLADSGTYWLIDPLDGTREYVKGLEEFTVNLGLVFNNEPIVGLVYAPVMEDMFYGHPGNAFRINRNGTMKLKRLPESDNNPFPNLRIITGRREADRLPMKQWLESGQISAWRICSSAYKYGLLAAGEHDIFVRTCPTYEWDTAAGDAILRAVGGRTMTPDGRSLVYGKKDFRNGPTVACNSASASTLFALELCQRMAMIA